MDEKPCCSAAAARKVKQIVIRGNLVGIAHLDETIDEVESMRLRGDDEVGDALLKSARLHNYIPLSVAMDYKKALLDEYKRRSLP